MKYSRDSPGRQVSKKPKKTTRERYDEAKRTADRIARIYKLGGYEKVAREIWRCARSYMAKKCEGCGALSGVRIDRTCKQRLCAVCMMRTSRVVAKQGLQALEWMQANMDKPYSLHMVTLTQQNVRQGELAGEIDAMLKDLARMRQIRAVRHGVIGSARTIEVTCNPTQKDGLIWHPHVHLIIMLSGYPELMTADWWGNMWYTLRGLGARQSRDDLQVEVHKLTDDGAVFEVSKYVTSYKELLDGLTDEQAAPYIIELDKAIRGRYLKVWTGEWRKARRALKLKEPEKMSNAELDEVAKACPCGCGRFVNALMVWSGMRYNEVAKREDEHVNVNTGEVIQV